MRTSNTLGQLVVLSLLLFVVSSALAWDRIYRGAVAEPGPPSPAEGFMVFMSGGSPTPVEPPPSRPRAIPGARTLPAPAPRPRSRRETVREGDSLYRIAERALGRGDRWPEIARLNGLAPPYMIRPGRRLLLPHE